MPNQCPPALLSAAVLGAGSTTVLAADAMLPLPQHVAGVASSPELEAVILAARRYAAFWNTGDPAYAQQALAADFTDRTLPPGREQGMAGPPQASRTSAAPSPI